MLLVVTTRSLFTETDVYCLCRYIGKHPTIKRDSKLVFELSADTNGDQIVSDIRKAFGYRAAVLPCSERGIAS